MKYLFNNIFYDIDVGGLTLTAKRFLIFILYRFINGDIRHSGVYISNVHGSNIYQSFTTLKQ